MAFVHILPLDRYNWEQVLDIKLNPDQQAFLPPVLYSLAQAKFENLTPYGIMADEQMVGLLMYGEFGGICWVSRIIVDVNHQRQGVGSRAMQQLLDQLRRKISCREIRSSYAPSNYAAEGFFATLGFEPMDSSLEDEVVVQLKER